MNTEKLWLAIGEIDEELVAEASSPPKKVRKANFRIILAAALITALSLTCYAAVRWQITLEDIFGTAPAEIVENAEQPLEITEKTEEISVSVKSALADGRVLYLLWQIDSKEELPENADVLVNLSFCGASVDTSLGYYCSVLPKLCSKHVLAGYIVADWNEEMQSVTGTLSFDGITVPIFPEEKFYDVDLTKAAENKVYENGEYLGETELWLKEYYPAHKGLAIPAFELGGRQYYIDSCYVDGGILYITICAKREDSQNSTEAQPVLFSRKSGEEIRCDYGPLFFNDKNGFMYWSYAYKTAEAPEDLCYYSAGNPSAEKAIDIDRSAEFYADVSLESTELPCTVSGVKIACSPISMSITGDVPEVESLQIFLEDGSEVGLVQIDLGRIIFANPLEPEKIASVIINGEEYLG